MMSGRVWRVLERALKEVLAAAVIATVILGAWVLSNSATTFVYQGY